MTQVIGKFLVIFGFTLIVIGGIIMLAGRVPWLGRLPGDILIKRENFTFYFPITTCVLASIILSLVFYFILRK